VIMRALSATHDSTEASTSALRIQRRIPPP
jgi:hypothetical protein